MADIMHQGQSFDQINIQSQLCGDGARDLCDFNRMSEPVAKMIGVAAGEDLSLGLKAAKGAGVNDPVAVALKVVAVRMLGLTMTASAGVFHEHGVGGEHGESVTDEALSSQHSAFSAQPVHCEMEPLL